MLGSATENPSLIMTTNLWIDWVVARTTEPWVHQRQVLDHTSPRFRTYITLPTRAKLFNLEKDMIVKDLPAGGQCRKTFHRN